MQANIGGYDPTGQQRPHFQLPRFLFHITHVRNLADIVTHGLKSHNRAHAEHSPVDISNLDVNARRSRRESVWSKPLHDYVPLYFRARGPMLVAQGDRQSELAVLYLTSALMRRPGVVFTDGNAAADATTFFTRIEDLDKLDWECIRADYWTEFHDGKRTRCAEVLVPDQISFDNVCRIVVQNYRASEVVGTATSIRTDVKPEWFF